MLPAANRMRRSGDFRRVLRAGDRVRLEHIVLHQTRRAAYPSVGRDGVDDGVADVAPIVGLVVGRSVGNSVVRHRVSRRLRAELAHRLERLPYGSAIVVRALPAAAAATSADLGSDLDDGLRRLAAKTARRTQGEEVLR